MKVILSGNPISTGTIYLRGKGFRMYMSDRGKVRKEQYQWEATSQWKGKILKGSLEVKVFLYFNNKRKRDWDNFHKLSMDALNGIVWEDDSQIKKATVEMLYDKENPRIEIEITE